jgi:hypothetical protein
MIAAIVPRTIPKQKKLRMPSTRIVVPCGYVR